MSSKDYDQAYFDRWYRDPDDRVSTRDSLERKVRLAVGVAEYLLGRRIWTVLDVGCGEAPWYGVLRRLRPGVRYTGLDPSAYVVEKFGAARRIRRGSLGTLDRARVGSAFDLIVCADVLQYVSDADIARGLRAIRDRLAGVAYVEAFAREDEMEGDLDGWIERSASEYRRMFARAGLAQCGPYCFMNPRRVAGLNALEYSS